MSARLASTIAAASSVVLVRAEKTESDAPPPARLGIRSTSLKNHRSGTVLTLRATLFLSGYKRSLVRMSVCRELGTLTRTTGSETFHLPKVIKTAF